MGEAFMGIPVHVSPHVRPGEMIWIGKGTPYHRLIVRSLDDVRVALFRANYWQALNPRLELLYDEAYAEWSRMAAMRARAALAAVDARDAEGAA